MTEVRSGAERQTVRVPDSDASSGAATEQHVTGPSTRLTSLGAGVQGLAAFLLYTAVSFALYAYPIVDRFGSAYVGVGKSDSKLYMWSLTWMPYALSHGLNPLETGVVWAPGGANLAWVTTLPGPSLVMTPVTKLFGPLAAYNLLLVLAPILAAWGAYLVCKRVTGRFWPSVFGGYLFGFSTYMVGQLHGHVNLVLIFPVPLAVYLVLRRMDGSLGRWPFVLLLAAVLVGQFSMSTELFATMTLFGGIALLGAFLLGPSRIRKPVLSTGLLVAAAYGVAALLLSPYLYYALVNAPDRPVRPLEHASADLLSFVLPRFSTLIGGSTFAEYTNRFTPSVVEDGAYLGVLPLVLVLLAASQWRRRATWLLLGFALLVAFLSLGPVLHIGGERLFRLPGGVLGQLPLIQHATPQRFPAYLSLAVAVIAALFLAAGRGWGAWPRYALVGLGAVMLVPDVSSPPYHPDLVVPSFFEDDTYRRHLEPNEIVLAVPVNFGEEMLWQAKADMYFRLAQGYVGPIPEQYQGQAASRGLAFTHDAPLPTPAGLVEFLRQHEVEKVVMASPAPPTHRELFATLGTKPVEVGGVSVYSVPPNLRASEPPPAEPTFRGTLEVGGRLRSFSLPAVEGEEPIMYDAFRGRPLVLNFFASWCDVCGSQLFSMERASRALGDGVGFVGVAQSDVPTEAAALLDRAEVSFPAASDFKGELFAAFRGTAMPLTVFIDAGGRIEAVHGEILTSNDVVRLAGKYFDTG